MVHWRVDFASARSFPCIAVFMIAAAGEEAQRVRKLVEAVLCCVKCIANRAGRMHPLRSTIPIIQPQRQSNDFVHRLPLGKRPHAEAEHRCKAARWPLPSTISSQYFHFAPGAQHNVFANALIPGHWKVSDDGAATSRCIKLCCSSAFTSSFSFSKRSITPAIGRASRHAVHVRLSSDSPASGSLYLFTTNSNRITPPLISTPRRKSTKISEISRLSICSGFDVVCCFDMSKLQHYPLEQNLDALDRVDRLPISGRTPFSCTV
jgi:hypothetical protein